MTGSLRSLATKKLPSYTLHKASGQARCRIDGKDFYLGPFGSEQSRIEYGKLIAGIGLPPADPLKKAEGESGITVAELIVGYLAHAEAYYRKNDAVTHEVSCIKSALRPLKELYGLTPANEFGSLALKAVRQRMIDQKTMCRKFINSCMGRIRRCFNWGIENELIDATVILKLKAVAPLSAGRTEALDHAPRTEVPQESIDKVRAAVKGRTRDLMDIQLLTGARPGEVVSLTWAMIDRTTYSDKGVWVAKLDDHKCAHHGHDRALVFGPQAQLILRKYLQEDQSARLFNIRRAGYSLAIKRACKELGIKKFTAHWLRHTAATRVRGTHDLDTAQVMLGHAKASMTENYAHLNLDKAIEVARKAG